MSDITPRSLLSKSAQNKENSQSRSNAMFSERSDKSGISGISAMKSAMGKSQMDGQSTHSKGTDKTAN